MQQDLIKGDPEKLNEFFMRLQQAFKETPFEITSKDGKTTVRGVKHNNYDFSYSYTEATGGLPRTGRETKGEIVDLYMFVNGKMSGGRRRRRSTRKSTRRRKTRRNVGF